MKMETEITVLIKTDYNQLKRELEQNNFEIKEEYEINDVYLINKNINIENMNNLDILKKCVLVRNVVDIEKKLLYKYKECDINGDIITQGKVECPVTNISKALEFMEAINYKKLFNIFDKCIVFANEKTELTVQIVNNKYVFIEIESKCKHIKRKYKSIEEIKKDISGYNLSIDKSNFFVKKAEMILKETLNRK